MAAELDHLINKYQKKLAELDVSLQEFDSRRQQGSASRRERERERERQQRLSSSAPKPDLERERERDAMVSPSAVERRGLATSPLRPSADTSEAETTERETVFSAPSPVTTSQSPPTRGASVLRDRERERETKGHGRSPVLNVGRNPPSALTHPQRRQEREREEDKVERERDERGDAVRARLDAGMKEKRERERREREREMARVLERYARPQSIEAQASGTPPPTLGARETGGEGEGERETEANPNPLMHSSSDSTHSHSLSVPRGESERQREADSPRESQPMYGSVERGSPDTGTAVYVPPPPHPHTQSEREGERESPYEPSGTYLRGTRESEGDPYEHVPPVSERESIPRVSERESVSRDLVREVHRQAEYYVPPQEQESERTFASMGRSVSLSAEREREGERERGNRERARENEIFTSSGKLSLGDAERGTEVTFERESVPPVPHSPQAEREGERERERERERYSPTAESTHPIRSQTLTVSDVISLSLAAAATGGLSPSLPMSPSVHGYTPGCGYLTDDMLDENSRMASKVARLSSSERMRLFNTILEKHGIAQ
ncbi:hypothetical protein KIPB_000258 [Kipferlia bialata]|uniref:Uncharacterized protein n=1 Tax=Kipferlia bialata TaxID=797122 RepID=A0A9K3CN53_9EUKA|nr:hypothetical protein KIPB_000258 [Kipferlia bialata]|eukprot:g258.t1